jgi:hypothetical protein
MCVDLEEICLSERHWRRVVKTVTNPGRDTQNLGNLVNACITINVAYKWFIDKQFLCFRLPAKYTRQRSAHARGSCSSCRELRQEPKWMVRLHWADTEPSTLLCSNKGNGKTVPAQGWACAEGSRNLRFPDFNKSEYKVGKIASPRHRKPLSPGNIPSTRFC